MIMPLQSRRTTERPASQPSRRNRAARRRYTTAGIAMVTAIALAGGAGQAFAVDPTTPRSSCAFTSDADRANNVQTCWVWSESMQTTVTVKVRASDQQEGESEQAIYFLGQLSDPITNNRGGLYSTSYNLVSIPESSNTWSANWASTPVDNNGNELTTYEGGTFNPEWETFIGEELPAYLSENFDINTSGNAISGLSISGGQAINLALKYPEVFSVAVSRSGYYQTDNLLGYFFIPLILATRQDVSNGFDGLWGNPFLPGNTWAANDVASRIPEAKANGQTIIISTGNGLPASQEEWEEMWNQGGIGNVAIGIGLEAMSFISAILLNIEAEIFDLPVEFIYADGAHTWARWIRTDAEEVKKLEEALSKYAESGSATASTASVVSALQVGATSAALETAVPEVSTTESETAAAESAETQAATATATAEASTTAPSTAVPTADVPTADVPTTDVPTTDVPATGATPETSTDAADTESATDVADGQDESTDSGAATESGSTPTVSEGSAAESPAADTSAEDTTATESDADNSVTAGA